MNGTYSAFNLSVDALEHNVNYFSALLGGVDRISAVVKGNAYGHSYRIIRPMKELGIKRFCVFSVQEALEVSSRIDDEADILILGPLNSREISEAALNGFAVTLYAPEGWRQAQEAMKGSKKRLRVHLKIDTGMHRLGIVPDMLERAFKVLKSHQAILFEGIYSHLADSGNLAEPEHARHQHTLFCKLIAPYDTRKLQLHINNTGGTITIGRGDYTFSRIGIGLYGYWPGSQFRDKKLTEHYPVKDLEPVLSWQSGISDIRWLKKGEALGYRRSFKTDRDRRIGLVPVGYADGYPFALSNKGQVLIQGTKCPVLGQVNMNYLSIDITSIPTASVGEPVKLLGPDGNQRIDLESWQRWSDGHLFPYESLCNLRNS